MRTCGLGSAEGGAHGHMRLVTYSRSALEAARVGVLEANDVVDLTAAYEAEGRPLARGMRQLLEEGDAGLAFARACVGRLLTHAPTHLHTRV